MRASTRFTLPFGWLGCDDGLDRSWMSFRCRFGLHSWKDIACPDGQYLRICTSCLKVLGPFAQYERQPAPRDGLRNYLSG